MRGKRKALIRNGKRASWTDENKKGYRKEIKLIRFIYLGETV